MTPEDFGLAGFGVSEGKVVLPEGILSRVMYWEIDPDYDGSVFSSRVQAARPWRKGNVPGELRLPEKRGAVCLRAVLVSGEIVQGVID
jgi:hypothetical protein